MCIDEVDVAVGEKEPNRNVGILCEELVDDRQHVESAKLHGRGDNQLASRGCELTCGFVFLFTHEFEDASSRRDVRHSGVGQRKLARGSYEQPGPEHLFEIGDLASECADRNLQFTRRCGQAPPIHRGHQHFHGF